MVGLAALLALGSARAAADHEEMERLLSMDLTELSEIRMVTAAGRFPQKLTEAPSRVTIVTADEIRALGHRNLADVVRSIRGLYTGYDGSYEIIGTRGVQPAGDYNTRLLVMIDGVRITDPVYSQGPVGNEFPVDIALVERVEFLPGPGSAAYGNNAFFGLLNVITRRPDPLGRRTLQLDAGSHGERAVSATIEGAPSAGSRALLSVSRRYRSGGDVRFSGLASDDSDGVARGIDNEAINRLFARADTGDWRFILVAGERVKTDPSAPYGTIFNDPRLHQSDTFVQASARRSLNISALTEGALQAFYNRNEYRGDFPTDYPPPTVNHDFDLGERYGLEGQLRTRRFDGHTVSLWGEFLRDSTIRLVNRDLSPPETYVDIGLDEQAWGVFIQDEVRFGERWLVNLGLRHDRLATGDTSTNPRLALIRQGDAGTTAKLLYGTAFRSPNAYERFYFIEDYSAANPALKAERVRTLEATLEQLRGRLRWAVSLFRTRVDDLIEQSEGEDGLLRFDNRSGADIDGVELEGEYRAAGMQLRASLSHQRASDADSGVWLVNSPRNLLKASAIMPTGKRQRLGVSTRYESGRRTAVDTRTGGYGVADLAWSGETGGNVRWSATVRNAFDHRYDLPATLDHEVDRLPASGRSLLVSVSVPL